MRKRACPDARLESHIFEPRQDSVLFLSCLEAQKLRFQGADHFAALRGPVRPNPRELDHAARRPPETLAGVCSVPVFRRAL